MTLSEEARTRLSRWCATQVPSEERARRQIGYTVQGDELTVSERRAPVYPELDTSWASVPLLQLRRATRGSEVWVLYAWAPAKRRWQPTGDTGEDPVSLLDHYISASAA